MIIEVQAGSKNKYEYDEDLGVIKLDRVQYAAMAHPYDYGFVPETRSDDGDHLDAFIICDHSFFPGCLVEGRPVGVMTMTDDGEGDEKLICVPHRDVRYDHIHDINDLNLHVPVEIKHFLEHYKDLQGKKVTVHEAFGAKVAKEIIQECSKRYDEEDK